MHPRTYEETLNHQVVEDSCGVEDKVVMGIQTKLTDGQKLFKCGVCGEVFKQAHSFSGHCRIHRGTECYFKGVGATKIRVYPCIVRIPCP